MMVVWYFFFFRWKREMKFYGDLRNYGKFNYLFFFCCRCTLISNYLLWEVMLLKMMMKFNNKLVFFFSVVKGCVDDG
ncbi:hypothetical protein DLAC_11623 [Tieghemostelium lacteum]|uniref:Uncharacterized protein n=1 Tax=Tieghemostelium lacteum TaxID=361077 RepID=A0A151ZIV0_TIELA|nr:hypothetical protein DLAC_11623 [Tieghemostelium lacteum]|eukprot:KYQ93921.1 hypothetical protein DLAC_11623 [Tieghemostelium lacteum]